MLRLMEQYERNYSNYNFKYLQKYFKKNKEKLPDFVLDNSVDYMGKLWPLEKYDIVHGLDGRRYPIRSKVTVTSIHDLLIFHETENRIASDHFIVKKQKQFKDAARNSDAVITISEYSRQDISKRLGVSMDKIFVTYLGIEPKFKPTSKQCVIELKAKYALPEDYLLFVGGISARKNTERMVCAHAEIVRESGVPLVLAGEISYDGEKTLEVIRKLGVEKSVFQIGYVDDEDLPALYSGAIGLVFPTLLEGFGFPILESMACGTPVLVSDYGASPEVGRKYVITCSPLDIESIADGMKKLINSKKYFSTDAIEYAQGYTWEKCSASTLDVYNRLL